MTRCLTLVLSTVAQALAIAAGVLCAPLAALAAPLDTLPDAVLGKPGFTSGNNPIVSATNLFTASALAEDPVTGALWVADLEASRVLRFSSAKAFANGEAANLVLGQPDFTSSAPNRGAAAPAANTLRYPSGLAVDPRGTLFVSDTDNHRVLMFSPPFSNGMNASAALGQTGYTSGLPNQGAGPGPGTLNRPTGLAFDAREGLLWVADQFNARVLGFGQPMEGGTGWNAQAVIGQADFNSAFLVVPAPNTIGRPAGLTLDFAGQLWVADPQFNRVTAFPPGQKRANGNASAVLCQRDFDTGDPATSALGCNQPGSVTVDGAGRFHVADAGNNRVIRIDFIPDGAVAFLGQPNAVSNQCNRGEVPPAPERLCTPGAVLLDRQGNLLVADSANGRVLRFDLPVPNAQPRILATSPDEIARGSGDFELALEGQGFSESTRVLAGGVERPVRFLASDRLAVSMMAADASGAGPLEVQAVNAAPGGGASPVVAIPRYDRRAGDRIADRVLGQPNRRENHREDGRLGAERIGGQGASTLRSGGESLAIDSRSGRVFVSERNVPGSVRSWPSLAGFQNGAPADVILGAASPYEGVENRGSPSASRLGQNGLAVALDDAGRLYVADHQGNRVLRFDPPFATGMAASRVFGQGGSFTRFDPNLGGAVGPRGLNGPDAVAARGNRLFVADGGNRRVLVFEDPDASDAAVAAIGQADLVSRDLASAPGATRFGDTASLAVDAAGRLFVGDRLNHRVLRFSPPFASNMAADLVIGQPNFVASTSGTTATKLRSPLGIAVDDEGNLLVADSDNHRIVRHAAPLSTGMAANAVLGQAGFDPGVPGTDEAGLGRPRAVAVDPAGNVLVSDGSNDRVLAYDRPFGVETSKRLVNLATRMPVLSGDDVLIGGFIIGGTQRKKVVVRARGPSLAQFGIPGVLANPLLQLFAGANPVAVNDNWQQAANAAEIQASGFAPAHPFESAILLTLDPGAYTAIVSGAGGVTGVGIVEVFEVDGATSPLVNIATRGRVLTGDNVLIGGFVIQGDSPQTVIVRARGPSLAAAGVPGVLANPLLRLFAGDGTPLLTNDDWTVAPNAAAIQASGFAPSDPRESAILVTLQPGAYTAVVSGAGGATGVALVEVFVP